jgi:20S proteasome alpha/beta subunit
MLKSLPRNVNVPWLWHHSSKKGYVHSRGAFKLEVPVTIAIGLLCEGGKHVLLCSDMLVSYGSVSSNQQGSKIYDLPLGLYAAVADDVSCDHVVISELCNNLDSLQENDPAIVDKTKLAFRRAANYAFKWRRDEILKDIGLTEDEFLHDAALPKSRIRQAQRAIRDATSTGLPIGIIVAGYVQGRLIFFYTDGKTIIEQTSPGVFAAGSGSEAASHWLNYREQNTFVSRQRSYYHLIEAMMFARLSPNVGNTGTCLLLSPNKPMAKLEMLPNTPEYALIGKWWNHFWPKIRRRWTNRKLRQNLKRSFQFLCRKLFEREYLGRVADTRSQETPSGPSLRVLAVAAPRSARKLLGAASLHDFGEGCGC